MFDGVGSGVVSKTLCGYRWMESKTAQLEFGVGQGSGQVPDISIDSDGVICNCPAGTFYQSRIKPTGSSNQNPPHDSKRALLARSEHILRAETTLLAARARVGITV